jgi:hypothetical protein
MDLGSATVLGRRVRRPAGCLFCILSYLGSGLLKVNEAPPLPGAESARGWPIKQNQDDQAVSSSFQKKKDCLFLWKAWPETDGKLTLAAKLTPLTGLILALTG